MRCRSGPAERRKVQTEKHMRPGPPGGHDKSAPQSRRLSSRMLCDPEGAATNLPKGHPSSSTLTLSLLTPSGLQSSPPCSQEVHVVHGGCLRSTFRRDARLRRDTCSLGQADRVEVLASSLKVLQAHRLMLGSSAERFQPQPHKHGSF